MANVFKRAGKDGRATWCIRYQDSSGKDIRQATKAKTKREAELLLAKAIQEIADGTYELKKRQREVTFFEICEDFMAYSKASKRSWLRDEGTVRRLKKFFGDCMANEITPTRIREFVQERKRAITPKRQPITPAAINREIACLRTIYNKAIQAEKLERNPMWHIKLFKENNVRDRVLSPEEYERLLLAAPEHLKPMMIAAYETGMRFGEIVAITWDQVDLAKGFIYLRPEQTKTNEGRKVPISPRLLQTLTAMKPKKGSVFSYHGKSISSVKHSFTRTCRLARVENFHFQDFRHTFVTRMRKAGKQDRTIMAITGHKTMAMLMRYDTVDEEDLKSVVTEEPIEKCYTNAAQGGLEGKGAEA